MKRLKIGPVAFPNRALFSALEDVFHSHRSRDTKGAMPTRLSAASLLIDCYYAGFLPGENGQCLRPCPGWRRQQWRGSRGEFLIANMSEDSVYDVLFLNTCDNSDRLTTATADLDVYIKNAFKALSPGRSGMTLGGLLRHNIRRLSLCENQRRAALSSAGSRPRWWSH
jgi:hypothetical protein